MESNKHGQIGSDSGNERRKSQRSIEIELVDGSTEDEFTDVRNPDCSLYRGMIYFPNNGAFESENNHQWQQEMLSKLNHRTETYHYGLSGNANGSARLNTDNGLQEQPEACHTDTHRTMEGFFPSFSSEITSGYRHFPSYFSQWIDGLQPVVVVAALVASALDLLWVLSLGSWITSFTDHRMGLSEVFMSTFFCGTVFALMGSYLVFMVKVSVPCVIFLSAVCTTADRLSLDFLPWMGWIAISSGALLGTVAVMRPSSLAMAQQLGQFSWETLQLFVGMVLIWHGSEETIHLFRNHLSQDSALLSLWLCTCSFLLGLLVDLSSLLLHLPKKLRQVVAETGPVFVVFGLVAISQVPKWSNVFLSRVEMAKAGYHSDGTSVGTLVRLKDLPLWAIFLSCVPGAVLAALVLIDFCSNWNFISLSEDCKEQMVIWKRRDLLTIAGSMIICGLMGLPPCYGLFPQIRPCEFTRKLDNIPTSDMESQEMFSQESQRDELGAQRACGLLSSIILGIPLLPGPASLVKNIPQPLLWGFCLQMGVNKLRRLWMNHNLRKCSDVEGQRSWAKKAYVVIQTVCVGVIFSISRTQAALLFPLFLLTALWLRHYVMGKAFDYKQETKASKANGEAGRHQSGELRDREKNWDDGKPKIRWLRRKRKRQPSLDVGLSSVSSSLRFVMRARETQKRRRNRSRSSVIYVGEEDSVDVHSNFLYDAGGSTSGLGFHCLDCRDVSVAEEAVSLKGSTISFEDWAHPPSNPPFPSSHSL